MKRSATMNNHMQHLEAIKELAAEFLEGLRWYTTNAIDLSARGPELANDQHSYADRLLDTINEFEWALEEIRKELQ